MKNSKIIKIFILSVFVLIFAFLFWQRLAEILLKRNFTEQSFLWLAIWLSAFLVFWLAFSLLVESKLICFLIYLATLAICLLFFPFHYYLLIGLGLFFLALVLSHALIKKEKDNHLKISLTTIFKSGLKLNLLFLAIFLSLLVYLHPLLKIGEDSINLPPQVLVKLLSSKSLLVVDPEMTIDETLALIIVMKKPDLSAFPPELIEKFQNRKNREIDFQEILKDQQVIKILKNQAKKVDQKTIELERNELEKNLGIEIRGNEKIVELTNKLVNKQLKNLVGPHIKYFSIILAALIFIILNLIFIPFSWLIIFFSLLLFFFLRLFGFVKIEKVMKEGEDIRL